MKNIDAFTTMNRVNMNDSNELGNMFCNPTGMWKAFIGSLPSNGLLINHIMVIVTNIILIIPTILLNAISIVTITKSSSLNSKTCYFVIFLQSVSDLLVGTFGIPLFLAYLSTAIGGISNCLVADLAYKLTITILGISMFAFLGMTFDRYIAVLHPFAYTSKVTKKRILILFVLGVKSSVLSVTLSFITQEYLEISIAVTIASIFTFNVLAYTRIYLVITKIAHKQKIRNVATEEHLIRKTRFLQEAKQAKSCFLVVISYFCLIFLPLLITIIFSFKMDIFLQQAFQNWVVTLSMLNSSANSVIFFWTKILLRREAFKMLKTVFNGNE